MATPSSDQPTNVTDNVSDTKIIQSPTNKTTGIMNSLKITSFSRTLQTRPSSG